MVLIGVVGARGARELSWVLGSRGAVVALGADVAGVVHDAAVLAVVTRRTRHARLLAHRAVELVVCPWWARVKRTTVAPTTRRADI